MRTIFIFVVFAFLVTASITNAAQIKVEKIIENGDIKVGDDVNILLKVNNPFQQDLLVKIVDKNIFGNNGINVQCLEHTLSAEKEVTISYDSIKPFVSGQYTLGAAEITYTNPETGKEETIKSNSLQVSVKDSGQQEQTEGITTIYKCSGVNIQSSSYSSSGNSFNIQIGGSNTQQQPSQSSGRTVQNNELNQNTNALKQQMEQQLQQQKQMEERFKENVVKSQEFQETQNKLLESGYNLTDASLNPETNNTGSFDLTYQKPNGQTATLKGEMVNGTMKNIMSLTAEDKRKILDALQRNEQFGKYNNQLISKGFNNTNTIFNQLSQNHTTITVPYTNNAGNEREIKAEYINKTIKNVYLEDKDEKSNDILSLLPIPIIVAIIAVLGILVYRKFYGKMDKEKPLETSKEKPINYSKESRKMLLESKNLFAKGREKDAYEKVSQAVRFYFSYKIKYKKDMTNAELLDMLKSKKMEGYTESKKCLDLCGLVEFAKYKTNEKDFENIIKIAEDIIG